MAKQMSFTASSGAAYPESYWRLVDLSMTPVSKTARVVFYGYVDHAARKAGKAEIGRKVYDVGPEIYDAYFLPASMWGTDAIAKGYELAMATADTNGVSFFEGAENV